MAGALPAIPEPFVVAVICPMCLDQAVEGGLNNDVPEMKGIEDRGVEDRDRRLRRALIEDRCASQREDIPQCRAAMPTDVAEPQIANIP